jgi:MFS transporter (putative signal transducer)
MTPQDQAVAPLAPGRVLVVIAGIYVTQSLLGAIMFMGIPAVLRNGGIPLDRIGLTALFMLPWTVKFLWSPPVERFRLRPDGRRRSLKLIVAAQGLIIALLAGLAFAVPEERLNPLLAGMALVAVIAATLDIACDGFTVEQLRDRIRGWGNVMQVGGGYLGIAFGSGLFLILVEKSGWQPALLSMAAIAALLTLPAALTREPRGAVAAATDSRPSLAAAFRRAPIRWGLLLVVLFQAGGRLVQGISGPFLVDQGADLATLGLLNGPLGIAISLAGVLIAGLAVRRWPMQRLLLAVIGLHAAVFLALLCALVVGGAPLPLFLGLTLLESAIMAGGFVILYTAAMRWSSLRQAGVDFTLFQCADAATAAAAGVSAGMLAQHAGYPATFAAGLAALAAAALLLPILFRRIEAGR